jgi:hypothetical protein
VLGKLAVETLDACILVNSLWRGTTAFEAKKKPHIASTKKDGFVAETSNKGRNIYIF